MMKLDYLFPRPVFHSEPDFDVSRLKAFYNKIRELDETGARQSNIGGWQSNLINIDEYETTRDFRDVVEENINSMLSEFGVVRARFKMSAMWLNCNINDNTNSDHIHGPAFLSGTYYIKVPESLEETDDGALVIADTFDQQYYKNALLLCCDQPTNLSASEVSYIPKEGKLIVFPANQRHRVTPTYVNEERISTSFDFDLEYF